jgi:hypothetical protein
MKRFDRQRLIRKALATLLFIALAAAFHLSAFDPVFNRLGIKTIDDTGRDYYAAALTRCVVAFAVARSLNAVVSVAQATDVSVSPAGVGLSVTVGEILDPINDLVERFSWVMLLSTTAIGIQKLLMEIGIWFGFRILLTAAMVILAIRPWTRGVSARYVTLTGVRIVIVAILIRFFIPIAAIVGMGVYDLFLQEPYEASLRSLKKAKVEIHELLPSLAGGENDEEKTGFFDRIGRFFEGTREIVKTREKLTAVSENVSEYVEQTVMLIIIFLVQSVLIPVAVFWVLLLAAKRLFRAGRPPPPVQQTAETPQIKAGDPAK